GTTGRAKATCPAGTKVAGGGVSASRADILVEVASTAPFDGRDRNSKPENGWEGKLNNETTDTVFMRAHAICADRGDFTYHETSNRLWAHSKAKDSVGWGGGFPTGGGVFITGTDAGLEVGDTVPTDSPDSNTEPDNGWRGTANNESDSGRVLQVTAICLPRPGG